jgi:hypothetical protein
MGRILGAQPPWTDDPVLARYRFTNVYRASDRVSQFLIRNVLYQGEQTPKEIFFRALLFKLFNRIQTWERLDALAGPIAWKTFDFETYAKALDSIAMSADPIYSAAYIMPSPPFGDPRKHRNHLKLLQHMMLDRAPSRVENAHSLCEIFQILSSYPSIGSFLAYQFAIDLNYSAMFDFSEMDFVVAGPGAQRGIRKCFVDTGGLDDADLIRAVTEIALREFDRLCLPFSTLWGRPLQLIDCQNIFCEVDKYARVVHPSFCETSGRTRIKQRFKPSTAPLPQWYPPKWGLNCPSCPPRQSLTVPSLTQMQRSLELSGTEE